MKKTICLLCCLFSILFCLVGCDKKETYNSIHSVGEGMFPTIGIGQTVYYKTEKNYTNNDIVVISNLDGQYIKNSSIFCLLKRVVATPNQTIKFYFIEEKEDNYIYDIKVYDESNKKIEIFKNAWVSEKKVTKDDELFDIYSQYKIIFENIINDSLSAENRIFSLTLGKDEYFVLGDNYNNSTDSRHFGIIKFKDIVGKVNLEYDN